MLVLFSVIVYFVFLRCVWGLGLNMVYYCYWFSVNLRLFWIYVPLRFLPFSYLYARESPPPHWKRGLHCTLCRWFWSFVPHKSRKRLIFAAFSNPRLIIIKERNRSRPKTFFTLLGFFETLNSQGKGFRVYWHFCWYFDRIDLQFIGGLFRVYLNIFRFGLICILFRA